MYSPKQNDRQSGSSKFYPKDPWKYIKPRDLTMHVEIEGKKWHFYTKCKCRATGRVGFYQLSHMNTIHDLNWKPEGNLTPIKDPNLTPSPPLQPPAENIELHDNLVFNGVNCSLVILYPNTCDERENVDLDLEELAIDQHN